MDRDAILREWLARTLQTYPAETARFLEKERDPFRNPVGQALKEGLPVLLDELLGEMNAERIAPALEDIVKIRAIQDFSASQALAFLFLLKKIVAQPGAAIEGRIDEMALLGFDLYMKCRERLWEIKAKPRTKFL